jgi:hypothetical protein
MTAEHGQKMSVAPNQSAFTGWLRLSGSVRQRFIWRWNKFKSRPASS